MNGKQVKLLRGQVRQVVQEILPQILAGEAVSTISKDLNSGITNRLDSITKMVKETLDQLDQRSKDMQSYVVRNVGLPTAPEATEPTTQTAEK